PRPQKAEDSTAANTSKSELPPLAELGMKLFVKHLLTETISKSVSDGIKELNQKLNLADEVEKRLLNGSYDWDSPIQQNDTWHVVLLRSGKTKLSPETIEVAISGKPFIRFTRIVTDVGKPIAIMTRCRL